MDEVTQEQTRTLDDIGKLKEMHSGNRPVLSTLEFLEDCIRNRMRSEPCDTR